MSEQSSRSPWWRPGKRNSIQTHKKYRKILNCWLRHWSTPAWIYDYHRYTTYLRFFFLTLGGLCLRTFLQDPTCCYWARRSTRTRLVFLFLCHSLSDLILSSFTCLILRSYLLLTLYCARVPYPILWLITLYFSDGKYEYLIHKKK